MKKNRVTKKLSLNRETIHALNEREVLGGITGEEGCWSGYNTCRTCQFTCGGGSGISSLCTNP